MRARNPFSDERNFASDQKGAVALEFALVLPIFLALVFSIFEAGWMMTKIMLLESAMDKTVRELRIGNRPELFDHDYVKGKICDQSLVFLQCEQRLLVELIPIAMGEDFPAHDVRCVDRGKVEQPEWKFDVGGRSDLVYIRACMISDPLTPGLGLGLALDKDEAGGYFIVTQSAFLNEPA